MVEPFTPGIDAARAVARREISPTELLGLCLDRIEQRNSQTNALVTVISESSMALAEELTDEVAHGHLRGPLHGVPIVIKDLYDFKAGVRNTFGSVEFSEYVPDITSTYVARLESAGAVVVGKGNVPEFGHKAVTDNALFGDTATPFNLEMNAGGSSGGCAAAVADGLVAMAQGSDAGGSIRIPAAFCGIVGLMPTAGVIGQAMRPDAFAANALAVQSGPMCRTVEDTAAMLGVMAGPSDDDPLSVPMPWSLEDLMSSVTRADVGNLRIGLLQGIGDVLPEGRITESVNSATMSLEQAGARVEETALKFEMSGVKLYELWTRHYRFLYRSVVHGFMEQGVDLLHPDTAIEPSLRHEFEQAAELTLEQRVADQVTRTSVYETITQALKTYDVLVSPTLAVEQIQNSSTGPTDGPTTVSGHPVSATAGWAYTFVTNLTGHPAISIPCGRADSGVPIGMQIIGRRFEETTLLRVAAAIERIRPWSYVLDRSSEGELV